MFFHCTFNLHHFSRGEHVVLYSAFATSGLAYIFVRCYGPYKYTFQWPSNIMLLCKRAIQLLDIPVCPVFQH